MKKIAITILAITIFLCSCQKPEITDSLYEDYTEEVGVSLNFKATFEEIGLGELPITKADANTSDDVISNVWVFQFSGTSDDSKFIGVPRYVDLTSSNDVFVLDSKGNTHRLVFIANTHNNNVNWNVAIGKTSYKEFVEMSMSIKNENDVIGDGTNGVIMSGKYDGIISASKLPSVALTRSVAKVTLVLKLDGSQTEINEIRSVRLRNIPSHLNYADALNTFRPTIYPVATPSIDYSVVTTGMPIKGDVNGATFQWYMPCNMQGVTSNNLPSQKGGFASLTATYFEILASDKDNKAVLFYLYPGANMTNDFNIEANKRYTLTFTIKGKGNTETDTRVTDYSDVNYAVGGKSLSNCYILNPPPAGFGARSYTIPVARVDEYWGDPQYTGEGRNFVNVLGNRGDWIVTLYWQDRADIVSRADANKITLTKTVGNGKNDNFTITVPADVPHGNFLVAISKPKNDGSFDYDNILWSWHFWVTDYDPYAKIQILNNVYEYKVNGGVLHRYEGDVWKDEYATKFILDRNIGTIINENRANHKGSFHYQFGRKDPFPANISLYDIDGNSLSDNSVPAWVSSNANAVNIQQTIDWSIQNPLRYIESNRQWVNGSLYNEQGVSYNQLEYDNNTGIGHRLWHDPKILETERGKKSIFDPSPWGFKVPRNTVWSNFRINTVTSPTTNINGISNREFPNEFSTISGLLYWPYVNVGGFYLVMGNIYYPASGRRAYNSGELSAFGTFGGNWGSSIGSLSRTCYLYITNNALYSLYYHDSRAYALPVRPIQE